MKTYKIKVNKPIVTLDEIELTEDQVKDLIEQYNKPTRKRKCFVPKNMEKYWHISSLNHRVETCTNANREYDRLAMSTGNCFATEQDAQDELNRRHALVRIWNDYDDKYSWDIDWKNDSKHGICYDHIANELTDFKSGNYQHNTELPYFKSAEDRNQFVEDNEKDLLIIFNIKK